MIDKLIEKIKKTQAPIVVGLDPTLKLIPGHLLTPGHPGAFRLVLYAGLLAAGSLCAGRKAFRMWAAMPR